MNDILAKAIQAVLADRDIKKAVLDYLATVTSAAKPREEWREVWRSNQSETRVYHQDMDRSIGMPSDARVRLHVRAIYSDAHDVGKITVFIGAEHLFFSPSRYFELFPSGENEMIIRMEAVEGPYTEVILEAMRLHKTSLGEYERRTKELERASE